jgi:LPS-assembly protein
MRAIRMIRDQGFLRLTCLSRAVLTCLFCLATPALFAAEDKEKPKEDKEKLKIEFSSPDSIEYDRRTGTFIATNGLVAKYAGTVLTARRARVDENTGYTEAQGDVRIEREGQVWKGEQIRYNFKTGEILGYDFRTGQSPFFAEGEILAGNQKAGVYVGRDGYVTTDDTAESVGYSVRAKTITIVPGEYIEATHAILYIRKVPVFYFPYYRRSLKENANHFSLTPGYRSVYGPFLLTAYNWYWNEQLDGAFHLDGRYKRGVGVGPDFRWHLPKFGEGMFKSYYANDLDPDIDTVNDEDIPENRYRVWLGHQVDVRTNLTFKGLLRYQSDAFITRDFFESEYRENVQPSTFVNVNQLWSNFTLDALAQPRVNDFFETVERLPDIKLTGLRQQIGGTPLYYDSESSIGYFRRKFAESTNTPLPYAAARADTYHQITLPHTFFGWLNISPRAGGRFTHYEKAHLAGGVTDDEDRSVFNTGAEMSFKVSRLWREANNKFLQIDGLRHIIEPSINYTYVPRPNVPTNRLPQFDYTLPTTRLLPIEFPEFNAIDSIDSQNVVRFGVRNKLQTKRGRRGLDNLLNWAVYTDLRLTQNETNDFSDIFSDADIKPFYWLTLSSEIRYDANEGFLREANHILTIAPENVWSWQVGQRYLESLPGSGPNSGNNTFFHTFYYRLNENWATRISHHFEARDGVLEEQQYTLYRDFRSWTGAITFRVRDRREASTDYTVAVTFSLKAFPRFKLNDDVNRPLLLLGY